MQRASLLAASVDSGHRTRPGRSHLGLQEQDAACSVTAELADLVPAKLHESLDLVVFNPPWFPTNTDDAGANSTSSADNTHGVIRGTGTGTSAAGGDAGSAVSAGTDDLATASTFTQSLIDGEHWLQAASYRDSSLMQRFFDSAAAGLRPGGRAVVVYCNYARLVGHETGPCPMEAELAAHSRCHSSSPPAPLSPCPPSCPPSFVPPGLLDVARARPSAEGLFLHGTSRPTVATPLSHCTRCPAGRVATERRHALRVGISPGSCPFSAPVPVQQGRSRVDRCFAVSAAR